ncbi:unnamed protein product [Tuber melanosporum]|uniref:(Perigord truffle) hypothetical protein n=1 Tax=Tuber melanosporum (strain Mel28) TaxID=656061 RepID=D5GMV3_TUBMM|nr:uncharacterized protein GSTUM_00010950001 [Tuber melanosporum]CAZ85846.1 unnamed protein product [Tuber melanosporum]
MTNEGVGPLLPPSYGQLQQFEPQVGRGLPGPLEIFRIPSEDPYPSLLPSKRRESPPSSRRNSVVQQQQRSREEQPARRRRSSTSDASASLTVPSTINGSKANLAEFASQITCFLWFESSAVLQRVAESTAAPIPQAPLASDAIPSLGFRKWVTTILSTTQVSQNVILLALLFIYRLKKLNPTVKGKPGSEFRLLTVALMLGNKFLDDNTYTNKTWAEVSGIAVQEIHVMEVEFLSNMRYSLFVGDVEWRAWHKTLGKFASYWDKASRAPVEVSSRALAPRTPTLPSIPSSLPSPPATSSNGSSRLVSTMPTPTPALHQLSVPSQLMPAHSPITPMPQPDFQPSRKRSFDPTISMQPPTKRVTRSMAPKISITVPQYSAQIPAHAPRLPANNYPPVTSQPQQQSQSLPMMPLNQLPFPNAGGRAMSTVYSQPTPQISPVSTAPMTVSPYSAHSRTASPYSQHQTVHHSAASSPTTPGFGSQQSPTWVRNSPYRPVRRVNTLLVPPAPMSPEGMGVSWQRMHYQPLAKTRSEYKTGVVPYLQTDWPPVWSSPTPDFHV